MGTAALHLQSTSSHIIAFPQRPPNHNKNVTLFQVKIVSAWVCGLLYIWTILAPVPRPCPCATLLVVTPPSAAAASPQPRLQETQIHSGGAELVGLLSRHQHAVRVMTVDVWGQMFGCGECCLCVPRRALSFQAPPALPNSKSGFLTLTLAPVTPAAQIKCSTYRRTRLLAANAHHLHHLHPPQACSNIACNHWQLPMLCAYRGARVICPLFGSWMRRGQARVLLLHRSHNSVDVCPAVAVAHHTSSSASDSRCRLVTQRRQRMALTGGCPRTRAAADLEHNKPPMAAQRHGNLSCLFVSATIHFHRLQTAALSLRPSTHHGNAPS